jgi:hypothetical protein
LKKIASILLIIAFLVQTTNQLWIWAAFKLNQDYIANTLCINRFDLVPICKGSCYLEQKLANNQEQQTKQPDLKTKEITLFYQQSATLLATPLAIKNATVTYVAYNTRFIPSTYLQSVFRPPAASCLA